jgi:integrase
MPDHITKRRQGWYAVLRVPAEVQRALGRKRFRIGLDTRDREAAKVLAMSIVAEWKREIAAARGKPIGGRRNRWQPSPNGEDPKYWREVIRKAGTRAERNVLMDDLEEHLHYYGLEKDDPKAQQFFGIASGAIVATADHLDEWIQTLQVTPKTAGMRRSAINKLATRFPTLSEIDRRSVRAWVAELVGQIKPATVQHLASDCALYWAYLADIRVVPEDSAPFSNLKIRIATNSYLPYTPEQAVQILNAADGQLRDLVLLAMYTGARREELCALKLSDVREDQFDIVDSKTEAGIRTVPIHSALKQTVARLVDQSTDDYLLPGLAVTSNGRGDKIGQAFSALKKSLGFSERHTFHSWRATVVTQLERAGVPEPTVQDIVGHKRATLTGGTYSGKTTIEMRREAIEKLKYPK